MKTNKIGIQGGRGSFSEEAAQIFAQNHGIEKPDIIYLISSKAVLLGIENNVTKFGVFFDPLADKLLVISTLVSFVIIGDVKLWMVFLISCRDIVITTLRSIMQYKGITMVTSKVGKIKTSVQIITISLILLYLIFKYPAAKKITGRRSVR